MEKTNKTYWRDALSELDSYFADYGQGDLQITKENWDREIYSLTEEEAREYFFENGGEEEMIGQYSEEE